MAEFIYRVFGCDYNLLCVCVLCGKKAIECEHAGCKDCDKVTGHKGCMNAPDWAEGARHVDLYARSLGRWNNK